MIQLTPDIFWQLGTAVAGGVVIGLALLVQIILRDSLADGSPLLNQRQRRMSLALRISAAIAAFAIAVLVLRLVSEESGRTVLGAASVLTGLLLSVLLGKRLTRPLTTRLRARFLGKKAAPMRS
jgi:hypothetical protein